MSRLARRALQPLVLASLALALPSSCRKAEDPAPLEVERVAPGKQVELDEDSVQRNVERRACEKKIHQVLAQPAVPGAPGFDSQRLQILTQAKAEPVLLIDTPQFVDAPGANPAFKVFRKLVLTSEFPWDVIKSRLGRYRAMPEEGRATLLRNGYLYAETPDLAYALVNLVQAEHLFNDDRIWVQRGEAIYHAQRKRTRYYFLDGPKEGEEVRLLLLDRIGTGPEPDPSETLVRDFRTLKYRLNFTRALVRHVTQDHIVATLRYDRYGVPTLLRANGARLELECEVVDDTLRDAVEREKAETERRQHAVQALRMSMLEQIEEQLPFDEPLHEYGHQLDGQLRRNWQAAYFAGKSSYAYNGDRYKVFDSKGRPLPPQVCVDFLTDTFERVSGTWWRSKGEEPGRDLGHLDYKLNTLQRAKLRRVPGFLSFMREHPQHYEVMDIDPRGRIELGHRERVLGYLGESWREYQPGDIVIIRGFTPWDPKEQHYHSFFIYESDPLTGTPLALVGNAGRPSVRYWEVEARRTPKRSIWHRVRLKTEWIEQVTDPSRPKLTGPPPISPRGNAG